MKVSYSYIRKEITRIIKALFMVIIIALCFSCERLLPPEPYSEMGTLLFTFPEYSFSKQVYWLPDNKGVLLIDGHEVYLIDSKTKVYSKVSDIYTDHHRKVVQTFYSRGVPDLLFFTGLNTYIFTVLVIIPEI